jgi:3-oxoacyl-[acyl-carrier-protein] synthase-3
VATFHIRAPRLAGLTTALPETVVENAALAQTFGADAIAKIIAATGIERRPVSSHHRVSELGRAAAKHLLAKLGWARDSVSLLIVVTQTPDYPLPATACIMQHELGLASHTAAFDIALGCSGYVYGLSVVAGLMQTGGFHRALLVTGDMTTRMIADTNRALAPLFGDAVAATALEWDETGADRASFDLGSDGSGAPYLTSRTGGLAAPGAPELFMDGTQVMAFSLREVAPSVDRALKAAASSIGEIDHVVLHQANAMMMKTLARKIKARDEQMVYAVRDYGNSSSTSIPLALCDHLSRIDKRPRTSFLLSGFGVGWSWASAVWSGATPAVHDMIRVP